MIRTRGILLFAICIVAALALSSCDVIDGVLSNLGITDPNDPCKDGHTFSNEWTYDANKHWHAATCEHTDERDAEAEHSYVDGVCICGREEPAIPHEHTFSEEWSKDANKHWHSATCEHENMKSGEAAHDYNSDYVCTVCGYVHEHTYSETWSYDENKHWHAATCEHTDERDSEAEHSYVDGVCICGHEEPVAPHEHTYSEAWSYDEDKHWHAATCEHTDERDAEAEHSYVGGVCICGREEPATPHEHTFSEEWSKDANKHWHSATCQHTDERDAEAEHDYNSDYVCTVCGYVHEHTYAEEWSYDADTHWHAATCGHDVRGDETAHYIEGDECAENCGYKIETPHEHSFAASWSKDESGHWHAATCEHTDLRGDEGAHSYVDGVCAVCGYPEPIAITADDIEQGGWAHGTKKTNTKRIRVSELIPIKAGTVIKYDMNGLELYLDLADGEGLSTGDRVGWYTGEGEYLVQRDAYLGITIAASGRTSVIDPTSYVAEITIYPGTGEIEMTYEKVNVYKFGGEGNDWCFVYLPEGYDPDRATPYPFVIANHGNGWNMDGSRKKANWTDNGMYMSAAEIAGQSSSKQGRFIATDDESLWYSSPTIEALLAAGYIVCGAQNYGDNLYGNDDCTDAVVDFFNHMVETYNVESSCHMIGASNGAMTTINAVPKLGEKIKSIIVQYPLTCLISHYLSGKHQDNIEAAYGLDTSKTYTKAELEAALSGYDVLYKDVVDGVKQGYFPAIKIYYSMTDTLTTASANSLPLIDMLENSGKEVVGVQVDADGESKNHGHLDHFDPEGFVEWFDAH